MKWIDEPPRSALPAWLFAPLFVNIFILLYGASFTLVMTVFQTFATSGLLTVRTGVKALRESRWSDPAGYKAVASGLYAGGFAVMTALRDETAAAVAIGVDTGNRVAATLEATFAASAEELTSLKSPQDDEVPSSRQAPEEREWRSTVRHGLWVALFVLLALSFTKTARIASICVLAAQAIVEHGTPLLTPLLGRPAAARLSDKGSNLHVVAVAVVAAVGLLVQFLLYVRPPNAWYLPNGSAMPVVVRAVAAAPLAAEDALEEVRKACTCDASKLHAVASHTVRSFAQKLTNR